MHYWNLYFLLKVALFYRGYTGFHWELNLALGVALAWPLPQGHWRRLRNVLAWPAALALLYHDSYLPPPARVLSQAQALLGFSADYWLELLQRLFSPTLALALVVIALAYALLAQRIRFATLALAGILSVPLVALLPSNPANTLAGVGDASATTAADGPPATPDALLQAFYTEQSQLRLQLQTDANAAPPFDIIVLHVCSLSWDDMEFVGLHNPALLARFDVVFSNFNSAASYSGPASLRVLHGTCGQQPHNQIYAGEDAACYAFPSLEKLGYQTQALLNHDGLYEDFAATLEKKGGLAGKLLPNQSATVHMQNFDGSPIYNDYALLSQWWKQRLAQGDAPVALYYNTISLHDGNRVPGMTSRRSLDTYKPRLAQLLADFDQFITDLEKAQRPVVLVLVPEHGAALSGDKMQISGMREIPNPHITLVPTAVKLIGLKTPSPAEGAVSPTRGTAGVPLVVDAPMSYLGLFALLGDWLADSPYAAQPRQTLAERVEKLPGTRFVAENADVITMRNDAGQYMLKSGNDPWIRYTP
ncbi:cellulose biosynthesis protein BcsG [Simplicispira psychrophila]|uniref:cellulose biosynthesis protein BcsG n=1 Tax=Simplicispira psychrophila TaxID=80882 RepID=UPI00048512D0|nr:cellulose biosynthesis protein BcsG [Simplicispira psychrophila]